MEKKSTEKWVNQGKKNCKSYVFFQNKVLDLSQFMLQHPGGIKAIKNYVFKDVTNILFEVYPHQKQATMNKLMKYHVGFIPDEQVTNVKQKADKSALHTEKLKQKKKVCFTNEQQRMRNSKSRKTPTEGMSKSRGKQNMKQSTHKSNASRQTSKSKSKGKKKQFLTSIRIINEEQKKSYEDYYQENEKKLRQKERAVTQKRKDKKQKNQSSCSFINNQLDQQKPNFRVPILAVKHMNRYS